MRGRGASLLSKVGWKAAFEITKALIALHFNPLTGNFSVMDATHLCFLKLGCQK